MYHRATEAFHKGLRIVKTPPVLNRVSRLLPIVQLSLFLWITYSLVQAVLLNKGNAKKFSNHYCMENQIECALDYKFDKVVYMWVDGVSWDTAGPIFDVFNSSGHMNLMRVKHDSAPWSGAVFSTYITGKVTKNMAEVNADNIVNQFLLNGKKVFLGAQETIVYVLNNLRGFVDNAKLKFYPGVTSDDDTKAMYGWLFNCDNTKREELTDEKITTCVNKVLGGAKTDDRSFFMESFYVDHKIHYEVPTRFDATAINAIQEFSYNVKFLKNWIDNNPEYLLVIVTDHGGKGSSGESVHGSWTDPNNYAWNLYYNPQLKPMQDYPIINTGDVATTMWQYFAGSGISIPAESVGITAPITDNKENYMKSLKANALQLKAYAKHINLKPNKDLPKPSDDQEQTISNLLEFNTKLSAALKDQKDVKLVIILTAISFCFQLYFLYRLQLTNFFDEIAKTGFLFIVAPYVAWVMLSNWTAGWMWDVLGTDNYNIYYYIILMVTVGATALSSKPRLSNSNDVALTKNSSSSYVSLKVYSECDTNSKEEEEVAVFSEKIMYKNETAWGAVREKRVKDVVKYGIEYILGLTPLESTKSKYWMVWFAVCFGIIGALMKGMIHQNFLGLTDVGYVQNHINIRMWIAFLILFMEFRWQRRLLTTFLKQTYEESQNILLRVFDPAYFPMYIKFTLYIFVFSVIFIYEQTIENGKINFDLPWIVYYIVVMHLVILLFSPSYLQRDLLLPIFALHLIVQTNLEQVMTCTFVLCLHPLGNALLQIYNHKDTKTKIQAVPSKHVVAYLIVIMFTMSQFYFFFMENGSYTINELNLDVAGMRDTTLYPKLSVLIIAYHKLSCFIILVPFLIRLACPNLPDMRVLIIFGFRFGAVPITNRNKSASLNINHTLVWNVLLAFGQISTLFFVIAMTTELKDASFFWTITIITTVCLYGVTELSSKGGEFIVDLFKMLKLKIVQNK